MIGSDNIRRGADRNWTPRGIGLQPTFRCWGCNLPKSTAGAKSLGPLKMKHCAACLAAKEGA